MSLPLYCRPRDVRAFITVGELFYREETFIRAFFVFTGGHASLDICSTNAQSITHSSERKNLEVLPSGARLQRIGSDATVCTWVFHTAPSRRTLDDHTYHSGTWSHWLHLEKVTSNSCIYLFIFLRVYMHIHGALNTHTRYIVYMDSMFIRQLYDACILMVHCAI